MEKITYNMTACYIRDYATDYDIEQIIELPAQAALDWAKESAPDASAGPNGTFADITLPEQWLNKLFVVIGNENGKWFALYNHDFQFSLRTLKERP